MKYPDLFLDFISDLYFQIQEVPRDFFVDIGKDMFVSYRKVSIACKILCPLFTKEVLSNRLLSFAADVVS